MNSSVKLENTDDARQEQSLPRISLRWLLFYQKSDSISGLLLCLMLIFSPWALGTTDPWSIWTMNGAGYLVGFLLFMKLGVRWVSGYCFPRWNLLEGHAHSGRRLGRVTVCLAVLTVLLLGYCFVSAWNAGAVFLPEEHRLDARPFIAWLPHSYDAPSSWSAFFNYLAIGLSFWGAVDWLLGKTAKDISPYKSSDLLPERLTRVLWVLTISGGLLALEGIIQRVSNSNELLFLIRPSIHLFGKDQFASYAYRSNACQYFNLVWPAAVALWWTMKRASRGRRGFSIQLKMVPLACAGLMIIAPLMASSRLGAAAAIMGMLVVVVILWFAQRKADWNAKMGIVAFAGLVLALGVFLGWQRMAPRLESAAVEEGFAERNYMSEIGAKIARDYQLLGTGPGTFASVYQYYRNDVSDEWYAQLHNDWLETLLTFGWVGSGLVAAAFCLVLGRWIIPGGIGGGRRLPMFLWTGIGTCLLQARWDFPFQIYSILFTFMIICAILFALTKRPLKS